LKNLDHLPIKYVNTQLGRRFIAVIYGDAIPVMLLVVFLFSPDPEFTMYNNIAQS